MDVTVLCKLLNLIMAWYVMLKTSPRSGKPEELYIYSLFHSFIHSLIHPITIINSILCARNMAFIVYKKKMTCLDNYKRRQITLSSLGAVWKCRFSLIAHLSSLGFYPAFCSISFHSIPFYPIPYLVQIYTTHLINHFLCIPTAYVVASTSLHI